MGVKQKEQRGKSKKNRRNVSSSVGCLAPIEFRSFSYHITSKLNEVKSASYRKARALFLLFCLLSRE
jgi:hypothetical protein